MLNVIKKLKNDLKIKIWKTIITTPLYTKALVKESDAMWSS